MHQAEIAIRWHEIFADPFDEPRAGFAVRAGLDSYSGDAVAVVMADASDRPEDLVRFFREMERTGVGAVFGPGTPILAARWSAC